jgi:hypothetical protein
MQPVGDPHSSEVIPEDWDAESGSDVEVGNAYKPLNAVILQQEVTAFEQIIRGIERDRKKLTGIMQAITHETERQARLARDAFYTNLQRSIITSQEKIALIERELTVLEVSPEARKTYPALLEVQHRLETTQQLLQAHPTVKHLAASAAKLQTLEIEKQALAGRLHDTDRELVKLAIPAFFEVYNAYLQTNDTEKVKYRSQLELFTPYLPPETWPTTYAERRASLEHDRKSKAVVQHSGATHVQRRGKIITGVVTQNLGTRVQTAADATGVVIMPISALTR